MKFKYSSLALVIAALAGCDSSSDIGLSAGGDSTTPSTGNETKPLEPQAFSFLGVEAKTSNTFSFEWVGADPDGDYKVCQKDEALPDNCLPLVEVSGVGSADVTGLNVFDAATKEFFVIESKGGSSEASAELRVEPGVVNSLIDFIKSSNADAGDRFEIVALNADGTVMAVGARNESSNATGINGDETDNSTQSGAVYVFKKVAGDWVQDAYIKAPYLPNTKDFGESIDLDDSGDVLAVGATRQDSNSVGVNGDYTVFGASSSGAVYIFRNDGVNWSQEAFIKPSTVNGGEEFGHSVSLSGDGTALAVGAVGERSSSTGVNGTEFDGVGFGSSDSGAAYLFRYALGAWSQEAYIKASNTGSSDNFGWRVALDSDGSKLAVSAIGEASDATGINGDQSGFVAPYSGAVYVFEHDGANWSQDAYVKASNTEQNDRFGDSLAISGDGDTIAVGAPSEDSIALGVDGSQSDNSASNSGAVYVFKDDGVQWVQDAYVKPPKNVDSRYNFGKNVQLNGDGGVLAISSAEGTATVGINGEDLAESYRFNGAVHVYNRESDLWQYKIHVRPPQLNGGQFFGLSFGMSDDGTAFAIGSEHDSSARGINGDQLDDQARYAGAAYIFD